MEITAILEGFYLHKVVYEYANTYFGLHGEYA